MSLQMVPHGRCVPFHKSAHGLGKEPVNGNALCQSFDADHFFVGRRSIVAFAGPRGAWFIGSFRGLRPEAAMARDSAED